MLSLADHYPVPRFIPQLTNEEFRRLQPSSTCPTCLGKKTFLWDYDDNGPVDIPVRWQCDCIGQIILRNHLMRCGLSPLLFWRSVEELPVFEHGRQEINEYSAHAQEYIQASLGLILVGDKRSGKSTWATFIMKMLIAKQWDVQCMSLDSLAEAYTATWARKGKTDQSHQSDMDWFTRRVMGVPVLLIDNIGRNDQRNDLNTVQQAFTRVTSERVDAGRVTLMTYAGDEHDLAHVRTDHLQPTTITVTVRGRDLSAVNRQRMMNDRLADIRRPLRLI